MRMRCKDRHGISTIVAMCVLFVSIVANVAKGQCKIPASSRFTASDTAARDDFGHAVSIDSDIMIIGAWLNDAACDMGDDCNAGAAYIYRNVGNEWIEERQLTAADATADDEFGTDVAIIGDLAVIGAPKNDDGGRDSGSAYVFEFGGADWVQRAKLTASDHDADDRFGTKVAISRDVVVIGSPKGDDACFADSDCDSGAVYVYRFNGVNWNDETKLTASDDAEGDEFGTSVAIDGDVILVGSRFDDDVEDRAGSVYVFRFDGNDWSEEAKLKPDDPQTNHGIGDSVAIDGNYALIGATNDDAGGVGAGAAYVFRYDGANWIQEDKLKASDANQFDNFGLHLAISGDLAMIGSEGDDDGGDRTGSVYFFRPSGSNWGQQGKIVAMDGEPGAEFGRAVALSGTTAVTAAPESDDEGISSGSAYVFDGLSDCNANGRIDLCDIAEGTGNDCNNNGVPDDCDIAFGTSFDCQLNGVPDECDADSDGDSIPDDCDNCVDIANMDQKDADNDGAGDACDGCPSNAEKVSPGNCGCDPTDSDGDGVCDAEDACPNDAANDSDSDGVCDTDDQCPNADDSLDDNADGTPDCLQVDPIAQMSPDVCGCGGNGGLSALSTIAGFGAMRRRRRRWYCRRDT